MTEFRKPINSLVGRLVWWLLIRPIQLADLDLLFVSSEELRKHVLNDLIVPICNHRDQRGDDRCWFDDLWLYWQLPESIRYPVRLTTEEMAARCAYFHYYRSNQEQPLSKSTAMMSERYDQYIGEMSRLELISEARKLRKGIRQHRDKGMLKRTVMDDKKLYALLREGVEADFRLPPVDLFLPNCALICSFVDPNDVNLSCWPENLTNPLAHWHPDKDSVAVAGPSATGEQVVENHD